MDRRRNGVAGLVLAADSPARRQRGRVETGQLALVDEKKGQRKRVRGSARASGGQGRNGQVGTALRSIFQDTVSEGIPQNLQDLLNKLD